MRKITKDAIRAFYAGKSFKRGNTKVRVFIDYAWDMEHNRKRVQLVLHGNVIAEYVNGGDLIISNGGWSSNTTKERLNGLTGVHIKQKDFVWYLNGEAWNGDWIRIGD